MKFRIKYLIIFFVIITLIFILTKHLGVNKVSQTQQQNSLQNPLISKLAKMKLNFINKNISVLSKVIDSCLFNNNEKEIIFLYNGFDCITCIKKGIEISKTIDSISCKHKVYIIATNSNISSIQIMYDYNHFIFDDKNDLIRKELKFIYTPMFIIVDNKMKIRDIFFITPNSKEKETETFIKRCSNF